MKGGQQLNDADLTLRKVRRALADIRKARTRLQAGLAGLSVNETWAKFTEADAYMSDAQHTLSFFADFISRKAVEKKRS